MAAQDIMMSLQSKLGLNYSPWLIMIIGTFVWSLYMLLKRWTTKLDMPVYNASFDVVEKFQKGVMENPDEPFLLSLPGMDMVILPQSCIDLIKSLPESEVSIKKHHHDVFLGQYTFMGTKADEFDAAMRYDLTRNTPKVLESFTAEIQHAMTEIIGKCDDWKVFNARQVMSRMAATLSGRAFVGLPLSRDQEWIDTTMNYTGDVTRAWLVLHMIPNFIKPLIEPLLPQVKSLKAHKRMTQSKLGPVLAAGILEKNNIHGPPGGDMLHWFRRQYANEPSAFDLTRDQLLATFASIYNLSNALTYLLFDIAGHPEHVEPLREELSQNLPGGSRISKENVHRLKKLDSFIRESQRLSPPSIANMPRIVTGHKGLRLPTGQVLPQGTRIMIRAQSINLDPRIWEEPMAFKGFRFSELRAKPMNEFKFQHVTTGPDNINFGHGLWACPGRFFANAQMKVVMAYLLQHYEIRLQDDEKPKQQHYGLAIIPDANANVLIKSR